MNITDQPTKGFISEILKDEEMFKEKKKNNKKKFTEETSEFIGQEANEVVNDTLHEKTLEDLFNPNDETSKKDLNQSGAPIETNDPLHSILDAPPYYYIFNNIPDILKPKIDFVDKIYFGAKMLNTKHMKSNMVAQPIKVHKLFIALLIKPPHYEDILKAHKASVSESSFAFNLDEECYYRWFNNLPQKREYFEYTSKCDQFGISLHMNYCPQKLIMALENVKDL
jgi:hypothetical protein